MRKSSTAAKAAQKSLSDRCKRGWNWHFIFSQAESPSGARVTEVRETLLYKTGSGVEIVVSGYPYGCGGREDAVVDEIREAVRDLYLDAHEEGIDLKEVHTDASAKFCIAAPVESSLVQGFARALSGIRRVIVDK